MKIIEYLNFIDSTGRLYFVPGLNASERTAPYLAELQLPILVGSLIFHKGPNGCIHVIHPDKDHVSQGIENTAGKEDWQKFKDSCTKYHEGYLLSLWTLRSNNFWHWTMEVLPRVILAQALGFDGKYIIPPAREDNGYIIESLQLAGIPNHRIIEYDGNPWQVEHLLFPQPINPTNELKHYPGLIKRLRDFLLHCSSENQYPIDKIYLARDPLNTTRSILNETPLLEVLFKHGFTRVIMERMPLKEQIAIMAGTNCLVGPHGAGMTHCLIMPPKSLVIEMFPSDYVNPCMLPVIEHLKHRHYMFLTSGFGNKLGGQTNINPYYLDITLSRELGGLMV